MDEPQDKDSVAAGLSAALDKLADEYGPLGVALAAADRTDKATMVSQWRANGEDMPRVMLRESLSGIEVRDRTGPTRQAPQMHYTAAEEVRYVRPEADDYAPAPFQCLTELRDSVNRLDDWTSTFIGRMAPYSKAVDSLPRAALAHSLLVAPDRSPLENDILGVRDKIESIIDALDEMNTKLAL